MGEFITKTYDNGFYYEGESLNGRLEGRGTYYYPDGGIVYRGAFRDNTYNGFGRSYYEDGTLKYEGSFANGKYEGQGRFYRPSGTLIYEGMFKNNGYSGPGILYDKKGILVFEGIFVADPRDTDIQNFESEGAKYRVRSSSFTAFQDQKSSVRRDPTVYGRLIGHCGYLIEFPDATLLFDYAYGSLPPLRHDKPLYIFITHAHGDHFNPSVFDLYDHSYHTEIFFGFDHEIDKIESFLESLPEKIRDSLSCFDGEQKLYSEDGKMLVQSVTSTDEGVAFIVKISGKCIFHSGDLCDWTRGRGTFEKMMRQNYPSISSQEISSYYLQQSISEPQRFRDYAAPLKGENIDYAMITLNISSVDSTFRTINTYNELAKIGCWSPMHMFKDYSFIDKYLSEHPEHEKNMIGVSKAKNIRQRISENKFFPLFTV